MYLDLSGDQELFLETTHRFLKANWSTSAARNLIGDPLGFDRLLLERGADLGWTSMLIPEELGGGTISGEGIRDVALVAEELGRSLFAGPVLLTNIVAFALARSGSQDLAARHLPKIAAGSETATWAVAEENDQWAAESGALEATRTVSGYRLTGVKCPVQDAHVVDQLLVTARSSDGVTQFLVPSNTPGLSVEPLNGLDLTRRFCRVRFEAVDMPLEAVIGVENEEPSQLELQLALAIALQCAETIGATSRVFEFTLEYVNDRKAFGRPIGSYQALKHRLADMLLWLESAKAATEGAVAAVQTGVDAVDAASVAKSYVADYCPLILRECLQFHGGIGFTWEHDLHLYMRRVESNAVIYGGHRYHRDRLASAIGL
jgi:alkylation response protein AidB-like acyl-CoA dehydrogenase